MILIVLLTSLFGIGPTTASPDGAPLCSDLGRSYAAMDTTAVRQAHIRAATEQDRLLSLYRLFPLTREQAVLDDIPRELGPDASARDLALLAALWSFRIEDARLWNRIPFARRSQRLLDQSRALDPNDPYVLLVEAQFLLYTPRIAGGSKEQALEGFRTLRRMLDERPVCGLDRIEVDTWIWVALDKLGDPSAETFRRALLAEGPPPLYRSALQAP